MCLQSRTLNCCSVFGSGETTKPNHVLLLAPLEVLMDALVNNLVVTVGLELYAIVLFQGLHASGIGPIHMNRKVAFLRKVEAKQEMVMTVLRNQ